MTPQTLAYYRKIQSAIGSQRTQQTLYSFFNTSPKKLISNCLWEWRIHLRRFQTIFISDKHIDDSFNSCFPLHLITEMFCLIVKCCCKIKLFIKKFYLQHRLLLNIFPFLLLNHRVPINFFLSKNKHTL
jgi:hypothetical protein